MASHSLKKGWIWGILIAIGMVIAIVGSTALSSVSVATATTQPSYTVKDLGTLGGSATDANAINEVGKVVGGAYTSSDLYHAVLWEKGKKAQAINNAGQVVGGSVTSSRTHHAVLWDKGNKIDLGALGGNYSVAQSINNASKVVGYSRTSSGNYHAFLWDKNSIKDLNNLIPPKSGWDLFDARSINNKRQIVGFGKFNGKTRAYLLTPTK